MSDRPSVDCLCDSGELNRVYVRIKLSSETTRGFCFAHGLPLRSRRRPLCTRFSRFQHAPGATNISTSVMEAFTGLSARLPGFSAHVMLSCLLSLFSRLRYGSAAISPRRIRFPILALPSLIHSLLCFGCFASPTAWIDFDPTNVLRVCTDHIVHLLGPDFAISSAARRHLSRGPHRLSVRFVGAVRVRSINR